MGILNHLQKFSAQPSGPFESLRLSLKASKIKSSLGGKHILKLINKIAKMHLFDQNWKNQD